MFIYSMQYSFLHHTSRCSSELLLITFLPYKRYNKNYLPSSVLAMAFLFFLHNPAAPPLPSPPPTPPASLKLSWRPATPNYPPHVQPFYPTATRSHYPKATEKSTGSSTLKPPKRWPTTQTTLSPPVLAVEHPQPMPPYLPARPNSIHNCLKQEASTVINPTCRQTGSPSAPTRQNHATLPSPPATKVNRVGQGSCEKAKAGK